MVQCCQGLWQKFQSQSSLLLKTNIFTEPQNCKNYMSSLQWGIRMRHIQQLDSVRHWQSGQNPVSPDSINLARSGEWEWLLIRQNVLLVCTCWIRSKHKLSRVTLYILYIYVVPWINGAEVPLLVWTVMSISSQDVAASV